MNVEFDFEPGTDANYAFTASVSTSDWQTPGTSGDDSMGASYDVETPVAIWAVAVEPYDFEFAASTPVNLRTRLYDANDSGNTFLLEIYDELEQRYLVQDANAGPVSSSLTWLQHSWTPQRAGYHDLSVRVNGDEVFRHRVDVSPTIDFTGGGATIIASEEEFSASGSNPMRIFTRADSVIAGGDGSGYTAARVISFDVDDGTGDENWYPVTFTMDVDYAGVAQTASYVYAETLYRGGVGVGIKKPGICWTHPSCEPDFVIHRDLWHVDTGGIPGEAMVEALGAEIRDLALEALVDTLFGPRGVKALGVIGVVIDTAFTITDVATCDDGVRGNGLIDVTGLLKNGESYVLYLIYESRVATAAAGGDAYAYMDFYDYFGTDCGGTRTGLEMDHVSHRLFYFPR